MNSKLLAFRPAPRNAANDPSVTILHVPDSCGKLHPVAVDTADLPRIESRGRLFMGNNGYARYTTNRPGEEKLLHRLLVADNGRKFSQAIYVDHINRLKHDCRQSNLQLGTAADNLRNTANPIKPPLSGQTGVYPFRGKWRVFVSGVSYGIFEYDDLDRAKAVARAAIERRDRAVRAEIAALEAARMKRTMTTLPLAA